MFVDHDHAFLENRAYTYSLWNEIHIVYTKTSTKPVPILSTFVIEEESSRTRETHDETLDDRLERTGYSFLYHLGRFTDPSDQETKNYLYGVCEAHRMDWASVLCVYRCLNGSYEDPENLTTTNVHEGHEFQSWWNLRPSFIEDASDVQSFLRDK